MDNESDELRERISQMSDGELLRIVGPDRNDYVEEAIEFAVRELRIRNIPFEQQPRSTTPAITSADETVSTDDESMGGEVEVVQPCDVCRGPMRAGTLFADGEVTMLFQDTEEERFVRAFACSNCGEVRLVVDFQTDIER